MKEGLLGAHDYYKNEHIVVSWGNWSCRNKWLGSVKIGDLA